MASSEVTKTLLSLTVKPHLYPDTLAWRAAADLLDESCHGGACCAGGPCADVARRWRVRARWLQPVLDGFGFRAFSMASNPIQPHSRPGRLMVCQDSQAGEVSVLYEPLAKVTKVSIDVPDIGPPLHNSMWLHSRYGDDAYYIRRALGLIDTLVSLLKDEMPL